MDCSLSGPSVHEISQAMTLEWVALSFSRGSPWPFWTKGLNWHLLHGQVGSLPLSHQGSPNLGLVSSEPYSEIRTWMQGVSLGHDPRKTSEEVREVRQGSETNKECVHRKGIFVVWSSLPTAELPGKGLVSQLDKDMLKTQYCPVTEFQRKWPLPKGTTTTQWQIAVSQTSKSYKIWFSNSASKDVY